MALLTTSSWFRKNYRNFKGHMNRLRGNCDRFTESDSSDPESLLRIILWMSRLFLLPFIITIALKIVVEIVCASREL